MDSNNFFSRYKIIETEDGSQTLFSVDYNESCHSIHGAKEETLTHYIYSCELSDKLQKQKTVRVLEIGFGTGLGMIATHSAQKENPSIVFFTSFEIDEELVKYFFSHHPEYPFEKVDGDYFGEMNHFKYRICIGNARKKIQHIGLEKYDCIYQDAFSPKNNKELWTVEWFKDLKFISHEQTILSTYCASSIARKSMLEAGWSVFAGKRFKHKMHSTIAKLGEKSDMAIIEKLQRSPMKPLYDKDL